MSQHSKLHARLRQTERHLIRLLGGLSSRDAENGFAYRQVVGASLRVLDVGGCDSLLPLRLARRGHDVTVYDARPYAERHPKLTSVQGDFLANELPGASFDYVVMLSTIEHIGFGSYGAPRYEDGDFLALAETLRLLKPGGRIVLTFPFADRERHVPGFERWYDLPRVQRLFAGLHVLAEEYYVPGKKLLDRTVQWLPASAEQIAAAGDVVAAFGSQCFACYTVSPVPRTTFPLPGPAPAGATPVRS